MASIEEISAQTTAATSSSITLAAGQSIQVSIGPDGLTWQETVSVQYTPDDGTTWYDLRDPEYRGAFISRYVNRNKLTGPGVFRLVKSETSVAIAVYYDQ